MAPFGLSRRQQGWGQAASGGQFNAGGRGPIATGLLVLLVGAVIGFAIGNFSGSDEPIVDNSRIIGYDVTDMASAPQTEQGAVKAATAFLIGIADLSVRNPQEISSVLDEAVTSPESAPGSTVRQDVDLLVAAARERLVGSQPQTVSSTAKVLTAPASYRLRVVDTNNVTVEIWRLNLFLEATSATAEGAWTTDFVGLRWDERWRVASYSQAVGPTPPVFNEGGEPSNYAELQATLNNAFAYQPSLSGN